mmetsp:Transcript_117691/g.377663  ORF Transcript_117691/g.377663 Transcript_117691/m.377663 type:complete len:212 (+) Transcript_117691:231-866(+)
MLRRTRRHGLHHGTRRHGRNLPHLSELRGTIGFDGLRCSVAPRNAAADCPTVQGPHEVLLNCALGLRDILRHSRGYAFRLYLQHLVRSVNRERCRDEFEKDPHTRLRPVRPCRHHAWQNRAVVVVARKSEARERHRNDRAILGDVSGRCRRICAAPRLVHGQDCLSRGTLQNRNQLRGRLHRASRKQDNDGPRARKASADGVQVPEVPVAE